MKKIFAWCMVFALVGCANNHEAKEAMTQEKAACSAKYPKVVGNYYKRAMCIDSAEFHYADKVPGAYDYAAARASARDQLAIQVDLGKITPEEYGLELSRHMSSSSAQISAQRSDEQMQRQRRAAAIMLQNGAFQNKPYQAPIPQMGSMGSTINCSSYAMGSYVNTSCH